MKLFNKLRSRSGASLLIAIIFMLVCTFVGGSVLAAASANTRHPQTMLSDQQDLLAQRSAVNFLKEELTKAGNAMKLTVKEEKTSKTRAILVNGVYERAETPESEESTVTIVADRAPSTAMEKLLFESAIAQIEAVAPNIFNMDRAVTVMVNGAAYEPELNLTADNKPSITFTLTGAGGETFDEAFTAYTSCTGTSDTSNKKKMLDAFTVTFGEDTQVTLTMMANVSAGLPPPSTGEPEGNYYYDRVTNKYDIKWRTPTVTKGGAAA